MNSNVWNLSTHCFAAPLACVFALTLAVTAHATDADRVADRFQSLGATKLYLKDGKLSYVNLRDSHVCDDDLNILTGRTSVVFLSLQGTMVTSKAGKVVRSLKSLQWLLVGDTKIDDAFTDAIRDLKTLQTLSVGGTLVSDRTVERLASLPRLRTLDLSRTKITVASIESLLVFPSLTSLDISETALQPSEIERLFASHSIRDITVSPEQLSNDLSSIQGGSVVRLRVKESTSRGPAID